MTTIAHSPENHTHTPDSTSPESFFKRPPFPLFDLTQLVVIGPDTHTGTTTSFEERTTDSAVYAIDADSRTLELEELRGRADAINAVVDNLQARIEQTTRELTIAIETLSDVGRQPKTQRNITDLSVELDGLKNNLADQISQLQQIETAINQLECCIHEDECCQSSLDFRYGVGT